MGHNAMNALDASRKITTRLIVEPNSAFSAKHEPAGTTPIKSKAEPDERLRQVMKHGDCTICLIMDHNTDSHMARAAGKPEKLQTHCTSIQNTSFHGSANHKSSTTQSSFHITEYPQDTRTLRDTGKPSIQGRN